MNQFTSVFRCQKAIICSLRIILYGKFEIFGYKLFVLQKIQFLKHNGLDHNLKKKPCDISDISQSISKQRFCQHGRHPKISITNIGGILHHGAYVRKQKNFKKSYVLSCVLKITTN